MVAKVKHSRIALVVDDSMLIRHTVCRFFEEHGFIIESASNGAEALEILRSVTPDIIITDFSMPKMNGAELIHAIRRDFRLNGTPIVVLAARRSTGDMTIEALPASHIIYKDIDIQEQLERMLNSTFTAE
ncbi:MAG TPA: response regulator [candidate division Zixibacteria bacterium]|nr:response regulator [candidate division Zixibacteria bacterium]